MYELNRVRLYNIGPSSARYDDVVLDLSDGGPPIAARTLIPSPGQVFRRPAPATLLVLENGGGKSVFIRMLLSTVLPERQSRKGREALRAYVVSAAAPSHVALEWVNVRTGETLVTGQVLSPLADGKPDRMFYSFNPGEDVTLASLPFAEGQRRLPMNAFHDALKRLDAADKSLHVEIERRQGEWENHLRRLGLEPDLFAVQQAMNVDEGDAAEAFKTTTGRQFVEWLLSKALDAENYIEMGKAFAKYAGNIGRREQLLLDRDFSTATAAVAHRLATRRAEQVTAAKDAQISAAALAQLTAELRETVQRAKDALPAHEADVKTARQNAEVRQQARDQADLVHKEVWRRTLALRRDEACAKAQEVERQLARDRTELAAWTLVPNLLKTAAAREKYQVASELLDTAEQAAGAAQLRRDRAGATFGSALHRAVERCTAQANDLAGKSAKAKAGAAAAERRAGEDERQATSNTVRAELLTKQVKDVDRRVEAARDQGILEEGESVREADARLRSKAKESTTRAARYREADNQLKLELRKLEDAARQLIEPEMEARQAVEIAVRAVESMEGVARALAAETLLRELAELRDDEEVPGRDPALWLETNASALGNLAAAAQRSAEDRLDALTADNKADQRLIEALIAEDEALMPPRPAVEDLLRVLSDHKVAATAGWRALEQLVNPRLHTEIIQARPALVDGIIVADQLTLDKARAVLAEVRPLPPAAVLVTTAASFEGSAEETENGFVVEPTPALHDLEAAAALQEQARARIQGRAAALRELAELRKAAFELNHRLGEWLREHPAADVERLRSEAQAASVAAAEAKSLLDTARDRYARAADAVDQHAQVVIEAEETAADDVRTAESFEQLTADAAAADKDRLEIARLEAEAVGYRDAAQEFREQAERSRDRATEYAVQAESFRRDAAAYADRIKKVVHGNEPFGQVTDEADLAALEISYEQAESAFLAVEVGQDLRQRVNDAQREISSLEAELLNEPAVIRARAEALAASPDAGSSASLEAAKRRLKRTVATLEGEYGKLSEQVIHLQAQTSSAGQRNGAPWTSLDDDWAPSSSDEGAALTERAIGVLAEADELLKTAFELKLAAERRLHKAEATAREMAVVQRSLASDVRKLDLPPVSGPFAGTADEAQQAADKATEAYSKASDHLRDVDRAVDDAVMDFRETANQNRFGKLKAPIYKQVTEIDKASLTARAGEWAAELTGRAASLTTDLEDSDRHRKLLIDQLKHHTSEALALLEKAERLSRLPESAGVWAGRRILKIGFAKPEPQTLVVRIAEALDENARIQPSQAGRDLVLRCVGAAVPRDFKVEILKPDAAGRAEYASISEMGKIFSGGQELTGAIMLYCTLAALRSSTRTGARTGSGLGGMLILDNPIGKASADYLLSLQMNMAMALGVQLIYTTGNMEDRVLATFPLCIRLRNDADQRTGIGHLHVTGRISAARLLVKPREHETGDETRQEGDTQ
ncbi:hypothetical protein DP939_40125 [Spongiactinospora rosea]|uniref:Chromosome segregation ATPase n=1 Tax=Spongiactinospora rosea TaxID=2248750 RepID=A0A366LLD6_9ACTN|nr:hypothetical protein [Spongiactinospora rosea]RBQ14480.1 hypothetical protein DP939_40125 [Spongiactinospora rosea]